MVFPLLVATSNLNTILLTSAPATMEGQTPRTPPRVLQVIFRQNRITDTEASPKTPPRVSHDGYSSLLTPPPTGGFESPYEYSGKVPEQEAIGGITSSFGFKRLSFSLDSSKIGGATHNSFPPSLSDDSQGSVGSGIVNSFNSSSPGSVASSLTELSDSDDENATHTPLDCFSTCTSAQQSHSIDTPFNFLGLPLAIRKKVYSLVLTIPALISVRQNRTRTYNESNAYLFADSRYLLPGIAFALAQLVVSGTKFHYSRYSYTNAALLRVSQKIHREAKEIMYAGNDFDIANLNRETSPPADFSIPLFPRGYARFLRKMTVRAKSVYGFQYLIKDAGHEELRNHYRGLDTLTLILEVDSIHRGYGRKLSRGEGGDEKWVAYVKRVHNVLQMELFGCPGIFKSIPLWINMKVLVTGDHYVEAGVEGDVDAMDVDDEVEDGDEIKEQHLKAAVAEAFELFKKGGRQ